MFRRILMVVFVAIATTIVFPSIALAEAIWSYYPIGFEAEFRDNIYSCQLFLCWYEPDVPEYSPMILGKTITNESQGMTFTATAETDPNFDDFVSRIVATDNYNDHLSVFLTFGDNKRLSVNKPKSIVFDGCPPLTDKKINSVSLELNDFKLLIRPHGTLYDDENTYFSLHTTFSFSAVPEPSSIVLLMIGVISVFTLRNRKK